MQNDRVRKERRNAPPAEKIGFVSQSKAATAKTPQADVIQLPYTDYPDMRVIHIVRPEDRESAELPGEYK